MLFKVKRIHDINMVFFLTIKKHVLMWKEKINNNCEKHKNALCISGLNCAKNKKQSKLSIKKSVKIHLMTVAHYKNLKKRSDLAHSYKKKKKKMNE